MLKEDLFTSFRPRGSGIPLSGEPLHRTQHLLIRKNSRFVYESLCILDGFLLPSQSHRCLGVPPAERKEDIRLFLHSILHILCLLLLPAEVE